MCRTPWKGERWLREECITVPASQKSGTSFSSNLRGRKELRNSKISRKSSLKKWISGHQSLQRGLREPLLRVRTDLWHHWDQASTRSSFLKPFLRWLSKSTSLGVFWCSEVILFDFKIKKTAVIFSVGGGLGSHAVWRVHSEGKKVPWRFQRAMQLCLWDRAQNARFDRWESLFVHDFVIRENKVPRITRNCIGSTSVTLPTSGSVQGTVMKVFGTTSMKIRISTALTRCVVDRCVLVLGLSMNSWTKLSRKMERKSIRIESTGENFDWNVIRWVWSHD